MNGEQQLCFHLKKNFERSLRFTCIPPPAWKCKFPSSTHGEARFRSPVQCAFKPPLFHSRQGEEGRREDRNSSQTPKLPGGTICFHRTKTWLRISNKLFRFPYLPHRQRSWRPSSLPQQGRALILTPPRVTLLFCSSELGENTSLNPEQDQPALQGFISLSSLTIQRKTGAWPRLWK